MSGFDPVVAFLVLAVVSGFASLLGIAAFVADVFVRHLERRAHRRAPRLVRTWRVGK